MITQCTAFTHETLKVKVSALPPQQPVLLSNAQMKAMCSDGTTEMSSTFKPDDVGARGITTPEVWESIARRWLTPPVLTACPCGCTVRTMENCYCMTGVVCSAGTDMRQCKVPMDVEDAIVTFLEYTGGQHAR